MMCLYRFPVPHSMCVSEFICLYVFESVWIWNGAHFAGNTSRAISICLAQVLSFFRSFEFGRWMLFRCVYAYRHARTIWGEWSNTRFWACNRLSSISHNCQRLFNRLIYRSKYKMIIDCYFESDMNNVPFLNRRWEYVFDYCIQFVCFSILFFISAVKQ